MGSDLGCFVGPSSVRPEVKRAAASAWGAFTPTTTGTHTNTISTFTSTCVTCSTVGGPVQAAYYRGPPPMGLISAHPARQVFMPQSIEQSGRFPGVLAGPVGILCPPVGTIERSWGDASARSNLRPEFDMSQVASRPEDRAVDPSGPHHLSHSLVSDSVSVTRAEMYSQGSHGARPKATLESQQICPAGMETGPTGVRPAFGASAQSSSSMGCPVIRHSPVRPVGCMSSNPLGRICSPCVLRHKVLPHRETKWVATSGHVYPVLFLACLKFHFLLM